MNLHRLTLENLMHLTYYYQLTKEEEKFQVYNAELSRRLELMRIKEECKVLSFSKPSNVIKLTRSEK